MIRKKMPDIEKFIREKHPELDIDMSALGLIEPGKWIILATQKDIAKKYCVIVDLLVRPRQCIVFPINDTVAYWFARNVLAFHSEARRHASECAKDRNKSTYQ
jgi:hypothetical protein